MPIRESEFAAAGVPTPAANKQWVFLDTDGIWKTKDETGTVAPFGSNASPLTTKGDLWVYTTTNTRLAAPSNGYVWKADSSQTSGWIAFDLTTALSTAAAKNFIVAIGDETTAITTGTAKYTFRMINAMTLTGVRAQLTTASTSGIVTVDINVTPAGSPSAPISILSTKLTIDAGELSSTTAAVAVVISSASLADNDEITIDIDGAGTGAKGLKVGFIGT